MCAAQVDIGCENKYTAAYVCVGVWVSVSESMLKKKMVIQKI